MGNYSDYTIEQRGAMIEVLAEVAVRIRRGEIDPYSSIENMLVGVMEEIAKASEEGLGECVDE